MSPPDELERPLTGFGDALRSNDSIAESVQSQIEAVPMSNPVKPRRFWWGPPLT
jgi:hypothetical protein